MFRIILAVLLSAMFLLTACSVTRPVAVTSNPISFEPREIVKKDMKTGAKVSQVVESPIMGRSTQLGILWFPPIDAEGGIWKAAENGRIKKISSVDYKISWYLFFTKWETIVTGER